MQIKTKIIPDNKKRIIRLFPVLWLVLNSCGQNSEKMLFSKNENIAYWDAYPFNTVKTETNDTIIGITYKFSINKTFNWYPYHVEKNVRIKYVPEELKFWKIIKNTCLILDNDTIFIEKYNMNTIYLYRIIHNDTIKFYLKKVESKRIYFSEESKPKEFSM